MSAETISPEGPVKSRRVNQIKLLGIFAIAGVPVILAMLMYFGSFAIPSGKTNKGELLTPPINLSVFGFKADENGIYPDTDGKWLLIQAGSGVCSEQCQEMVHLARQVNVLMAREQDRVARVLLTTDIEKATSVLAGQYPQLSIRGISSEQFAKIGHLTEGATGHAEEWQIWLSDPLGNVILRYDVSHSGYDLRDDLKKLLKLSNIG